MKSWAGTTYGNDWMHKWLIRMLVMIDTRVFYAFVAVFVAPVCMIVNPGRRHICNYFRLRWGMSWIKALWMTYRNFIAFGETVIDKFAVYAGKKFEIEIEGYEHYDALMHRPEAFIQFSSHIGNYEIAGYSLIAREKPLNAVLYGGEKDSVMKNREKVFAGTNIKMIAIREGSDYIFEITSAINRGEALSIAGDRILGSAKTMKVSLLGKETEIPAGPFVVATSYGLDVLEISVMKVKHNRYRIYVTPLSYDKRATKTEKQNQLVHSYINELENRIRQYPIQWYNYYDFWKDVEA